MLCAPTQPWAETKQADKADYLSLAALLIKDGHYERAAAALDNVDTTKEETDLARYYTLRGLVDLSLQNYEGARVALEKAVAAGQEDAIIHVYLAQVHYNLGDYRATLACLDKAGGVAGDRPELFLMRSQAHWKLGERRTAWETLSRGEARFPEETEFPRRKVFLLIELGLFQAAAEQGRDYLGRAEPALEDYLAIGGALRRSGQSGEALPFLEAAMLKFPSERDAMLESAHAYLDMGKKKTAADIYERAALHDPALAVEAAEVHRRAKQYFRALYINARVGDQKEKIKQRLAILLDLEQYGKVTAMEEALHRVRLLDDEDVRYALAFARFKAGDYEGAEGHLKHLAGVDAFQKATRLRKTMEDCLDTKWLCY